MWQSLPDMLDADSRTEALSATGASLRREAETLALMAAWHEPTVWRTSRGPSATPYSPIDRNGMSVGIVRDVLRPMRGRSTSVRTRPTNPTPTPRVDRAAVERASVPVIRMGDLD
jgi:hypothetical protein